MNHNSRFATGMILTIVVAIALAMGAAFATGAYVTYWAGFDTLMVVPPVAQFASVATIVVGVIVGFSATVSWAERA